MRKTVIGVMVGSKAKPAVLQCAHELGALIARQDWILLNGGRNNGVMAASSRGAREAGGLVIGILPDKTPARASPDLDVAILTDMGDARNVINVLSSDFVVACPGRMGTLSEVALALNAGKLVILLGWDVGPAFLPNKRKGRLVRVDSPEAVIDFISKSLAEQATLRDIVPAARD